MVDRVVLGKANVSVPINLKRVSHGVAKKTSQLLQFSASVLNCRLKKTMARKLYVEELRVELAKHGLDTSGTKATLARRLSAALKEKQKLMDSNEDFKAADIGKKRGREIENESPNKVMAVEELRKLTVGQLREQATIRGILATGSKKELLERLCQDEEKLPSDGVKEEVGEKIVKATKKGAAVLDQWIPDHIKEQYHVLQQWDDVYDALLNQTIVGSNNNKFYIIQCLESDDGRSYIFYSRWGRVGAKGQTSLVGPISVRQTAISMFQAKFDEKTKNLWSNRKDFRPHPKGYTWLEMDYTKIEKESDVKDKSGDSIGVELRGTKLEPRVAKFISLIFNVSMMKQQMMEIGYNADKLPLGKLSKSTILKGYDVLKRISDAIDQGDSSKLEQLSSEFYTVIPHNFGFKKMRDFVIDTPLKLKQKLEMVEALGEIEVATKLLKDDISLQEDPLYYHYKLLRCDLAPVEVDSDEYALIKKYMQNSHACTHWSYTAEIVQIFKVARDAEIERFEKFSSTKNRMLLWHGSRLTNWTGILSQGLRIAPPEAPVAGYMFGKGVYFADMFSRSANFSFGHTYTSSPGVLVLCEVALGDMNELMHAKSDADKLPPGKLSTKGVGATAPDPSEAQTIKDGIIVPLGTPKLQKSQGQTSLHYNEYIVYNVEQIRMRYVIQLNFMYK